MQTSNYNNRCIPYFEQVHWVMWDYLTTVHKLIFTVSLKQMEVFW